jgi:predicted DNA-binding protein (MmcQ/YjbR family)
VNVARSTKKTDAILKKLRAFGLAYPGAHTKSPWPGHLDLAVNDKTFAYLSLEGEPLAISCKLPDSCEMALMLPNTKPTAYGLGRAGWVSVTFDDAKDVDVEMLESWIDESYRAQAPKRLVKELDGEPPSGSKKSATKKKAPSRKSATKKKSPSKKKAPSKRKPAKKRAPSKRKPAKKKAPSKRKAPVRAPRKKRS